MAKEKTVEIDFSALEKSEVAVITPTPVNVPDKVKAFVDAAHDFWKESPKKWRSVTLASEEVVTEVRKMAAKYATSTGRTFRTNKQETKNGTLVYKVSDIVKHKDSQTTTDNNKGSASDNAGN